MSIDPVVIDGDGQFAELDADVDTTIFDELEAVLFDADELVADGDASFDEVVTTL